jgi:hypothetical protein
MKKKRILLGASYSAIEPLGLIHLAGQRRLYENVLYFKDKKDD